MWFVKQSEFKTNCQIMQIHLPKQPTSSSLSKSVSFVQFITSSNPVTEQAKIELLPCFFMKIHTNLPCVGFQLKALRQWTSKLRRDSQKKCLSSQQYRNYLHNNLVTFRWSPKWNCRNSWYFNLLSQRSRWCDHHFGWLPKHAKIDWSHTNTLNDEPDGCRLLRLGEWEIQKFVSANSSTFSVT